MLQAQHVDTDYVSEVVAQAGGVQMKDVQLHGGARGLQCSRTGRRFWSAGRKRGDHFLLPRVRSLTLAAKIGRGRQPHRVLICCSRRIHSSSLAIQRIQLLLGGRKRQAASPGCAEIARFCDCKCRREFKGQMNGGNRTESL